MMARLAALLLVGLPLVDGFGSLQYLRSTATTSTGTSTTAPAAAAPEISMGTANAAYTDQMAANQPGGTPAILRNGGELTVDNEVYVRRNPLTSKLEMGLKHMKLPPPPNPPPPPSPPPTPKFTVFNGGVCTGCIGYGCEDCCEYITAYEVIPNLEPPLAPPTVPLRASSHGAPIPYLRSERVQRTVHH